MRVAIFAEISESQLSYLRDLAQSKNIEATFVVEGNTTTVVETPVETPLTGEMLNAIANETGKTVLEVATMATNWNIKTVQNALEHEDVPAKVKDILYEYL